MKTNGGITEENLAQAVNRLEAFPLMTTDIGTDLSSGDDSSGRNLSSLTQVAKKSIDSFLGWQTDAGDPKSFVSAITQAFDLSEVEGHVQSKWNARSGVVQVSLEGGGPSGAHGSLLKRFSDAVDRARPLLAGLYPLRLAADPEDKEAIRVLVLSQMDEAVKELSRLEGPRSTRMEQIFEMLLGHQDENTPSPDPDDVGGQLGALRKEFGLRSTSKYEEEIFKTYLGKIEDVKTHTVEIDRLQQQINGLSEQIQVAEPQSKKNLVEQHKKIVEQHTETKVRFEEVSKEVVNLEIQLPKHVVEAGNLVNTREEETDLTQFRIVADYLVGLRQSWIRNRRFFQRPARNPFFGTQLVLLERKLSVIAESVREFRQIAKSVFIGAAELQTLEIVFHKHVIQDLPKRPDRPTETRHNSIQSGPLFAAEILDWIYDFSINQVPRTLRDGGKYAARHNVVPIAVKLRNLVLGWLEHANTLPAGCDSLRVKNALQELAVQLDELAILASPLNHNIPSQK